ncbi:MAG: DUF3644 domain-containing protein [Spirochaetales bacterium]
MKQRTSYAGIYSVLQTKFRSGQPLSAAELAQAASLKEASLRVYIRNRLLGKYLRRRPDSQYDVLPGIESTTESEFTEWMSQKTVSDEGDATPWKDLLRNANQSLLASIEIHNKPIFSYRYQVVVILIINAWELILKAFILRFSPNVKLFYSDGTTKPFPDCLAHVQSQVGARFPGLCDNLEVLYRYRNEFIHFYSDGIDVLVFSIVHRSVHLFHEFVTDVFGAAYAPKGNFVILPIGFRKPVSPLDFLTNESVLSAASPAVKSIVADLISRTERLNSEGVDDLIFVPYSVATINEHRVNNADIVAAISSDKKVSIKVSHEVQFTNNPNAKSVRIDEDTLYHDHYKYRYDDVVQFCKDHFPDFKRNREFHDTMKELKKDSNLHRERLLDPDRPGGTKKDFYSDLLLRALEEKYRGG